VVLAARAVSLGSFVNLKFPVWSVPTQKVPLEDVGAETA
jgi:hypothetical protein